MDDQKMRNDRRNDPEAHPKISSGSLDLLEMMQEMEKI
jgi:hypothetical protein